MDGCLLRVTFLEQNRGASPQAERHLWSGDIISLTSPIYCLVWGDHFILLLQPLEWLPLEDSSVVTEQGRWKSSIYSRSFHCHPWHLPTGGQYISLSQPRLWQLKMSPEVPNHLSGESNSNNYITFKSKIILSIKGTPKPLLEPGTGFMVMNSRPCCRLLRHLQ